MAKLTPPEKMALGMIEALPIFGDIDHSAVGAQAEALLKRFAGVSPVALSRFLMSAAVGLETALMSSDDPEVQARAAKAYCIEMQILAAAVTRKERGLPPFGANGTAPAAGNETEE